MLLLLLFMAGQIPFHVFHGHDADENLLALHLGHTQAESCELDTYFCKAGIQADCEHHVHVSKKLKSCTTCQYHCKKYESESNPYKKYTALSVSFYYDENRHIPTPVFLPWNGGRDPPMLS